MKMSNRTIKILENGRMVTRGLFRRGNAAEIIMDRNERLPVTVDWSDWLGSDTISSVTNDAEGASVASESNTTTTATFTISGASTGYVDNRITTAAGSIKEIRLHVVNYEGSRIKYYGR
jgi:hypothetical protein